MRSDARRGSCCDLAARVRDRLERAARLAASLHTHYSNQAQLDAMHALLVHVTETMDLDPGFGRAALDGRQQLQATYLTGRINNGLNSTQTRLTIHRKTAGARWGLSPERLFNNRISRDFGGYSSGSHLSWTGAPEKKALSLSNIRPYIARSSRTTWINENFAAMPPSASSSRILPQVRPTLPITAAVGKETPGQKEVALSSSTEKAEKESGEQAGESRVMGPTGDCPRQSAEMASVVTKQIATAKGNGQEADLSIQDEGLNVGVVETEIELITGESVVKLEDTEKNEETGKQAQTDEAREPQKTERTEIVAIPVTDGGAVEGTADTSLASPECVSRPPEVKNTDLINLDVIPTGAETSSGTGNATGMVVEDKLLKLKQTVEAINCKPIDSAGWPSTQETGKRGRKSAKKSKRRPPTGKTPRKSRRCEQSESCCSLHGESSSYDQFGRAISGDLLSNGVQDEFVRISDEPKRFVEEWIFDGSMYQLVESEDNEIRVGRKPPVVDQEELAIDQVESLDELDWETRANTKRTGTHGAKRAKSKNAPRVFSHEPKHSKSHAEMTTSVNFRGNKSSKAKKKKAKESKEMVARALSRLSEASAEKYDSEDTEAWTRPAGLSDYTCSDGEKATAGVVVEPGRAYTAGDEASQVNQPALVPEQTSPGLHVESASSLPLTKQHSREPLIDERGGTCEVNGFPLQVEVHMAAELADANPESAPENIQSTITSADGGDARDSTVEQELELRQKSSSNYDGELADLPETELVYTIDTSQRSSAMTQYTDMTPLVTPRAQSPDAVTPRRESPGAGDRTLNNSVTSYSRMKLEGECDEDFVTRTLRVESLRGMFRNLVRQTDSFSTS